MMKLDCWHNNLEGHLQVHICKFTQPNTTKPTKLTFFTQWKGERIYKRTLVGQFICQIGPGGNHSQSEDLVKLTTAEVLQVDGDFSRLDLPVASLQHPADAMVDEFMICGVVGHSLIIGREVLILTLSILLALQGYISWYIPRDGLIMREWPYTASSQNDPQASPSGHLSVYSPIHPSSRQCMNTI